MRSIILCLSLTTLAAVPATAAAPWTGAPGARCADNPSRHFARPGKGAMHKKLTELPPADAFLAVYRRDADGCMVPVKVDFRPNGRRR